MNNITPQPNIKVISRAGSWYQTRYQTKSKIKINTTVCPGSSDPPEKILNMFASENEVYNIF